MRLDLGEGRLLIGGVGDVAEGAGERHPSVARKTKVLLVGRIMRVRRPRIEARSECRCIDMQLLVELKRARENEDDNSALYAVAERDAMPDRS